MLDGKGKDSQIHVPLYAPGAHERFVVFGCLTAQAIIDVDGRERKIQRHQDVGEYDGIRPTAQSDDHELARSEELMFVDVCFDAFDQAVHVAG